MQRRNTSEKMFPLIRLVEENKLSVAEFCDRTGLKECSFQYWRSRYMKQHRSERKFLPISTRDMSTGEYLIEVELLNGVKLRFSSLIPADYLRQILDQR
jgi:hypothetical protein